jgi:lanosterol synthase
MAKDTLLDTTQVSATNGHTTSSENGVKRSIAEVGDTEQVCKRPRLSSRTDYSKWRLLDERGRQTWHYLEDDEATKEWPQSTADKYFLGLPTVITSVPINVILSHL